MNDFSDEFFEELMAKIKETDPNYTGYYFVAFGIDKDGRRILKASNEDMYKNQALSIINNLIKKISEAEGRI